MEVMIFFATIQTTKVITITEVDICTTEVATLNITCY